MALPAVAFAFACLGAGVLLTGSVAAQAPEVSALVQRARLWTARDRPDLARDALSAWPGWRRATPTGWP